MALLLADLYRKNRRFGDAYKLYHRVTRGRKVLSESEIARAYLIMGSISNQRAQYEKAREALNRCIALAEKDTETQGLIQSAFIQLGNSYRREGKNWEAIKAYEDGFGLGYGPENSDYWEMRFRLALSYLEVGENLKAEPLLNEISEEGDPLLQQKVLIKLGTIGLKKQLRRLSIWPDVGEGSL
jgi:tetratricopeptide (TPR) repeat protein